MLSSIFYAKLLDMTDNMSSVGICKSSCRLRWWGWWYLWTRKKFLRCFWYFRGSVVCEIWLKMYLSLYLGSSFSRNSWNVGNTDAKNSIFNTTAKLVTNYSILVKPRNLKIVKTAKIKCCENFLPESSKFF